MQFVNEEYDRRGRQIKNAVVSKGHDADTLKAQEIIYNKLPACCKYRNNKCELPKK